MTTDWIIRVGDGKNFCNSFVHKIWGIQTTTSPHGKYFGKNVKQGDRLWFVTSKSNGQIIAVATFDSHNKREVGPLINMTLTSDELGWEGENIDWTSDTEIHYKNLYNVTRLKFLTHIKDTRTFRKYDERCKVNLAVTYKRIVRYSQISLEM